MTDDQIANDRAIEVAAKSPVTQAILLELKGWLRKEIWGAAIVCSGIIGAIVYCKYVADMADLKSEIQKRLEINQNQTINLQQRDEDPAKALAKEILLKRGKI